MNHLVGQPLLRKDRPVPRAGGAASSARAFRPNRAARLQTLVKGEGMHVWDERGNRFLDAMSGQWNALAGHGHPDLKRAAAMQLDALSSGGPYFAQAHPLLAGLDAKLLALLPPPAGQVRYVDSGFQANTLMLHSARRFWQAAGRPHKQMILTRDADSVGAHPIATASAWYTATPASQQDSVQDIGNPYWYGYTGYLTEYEFGLAAARQLETAIHAIGAENIAAFAAEPFQAEGGMVYPPYSYWPEIQRICQQYDLLLCIDETVGFGRTGKWLASAHFGIEPDLIALSDGMTSGHVPMGALVLTHRIADALADMHAESGPGHASRCHPLAAAVALANLHVLADGGLMAQVEHDIGLYFQHCLRERFDGHPIVGQIQGSGMIAALQLAVPGAGKNRFERRMQAGLQCMRHALKQRLIVRAAADRIMLAPALVASHDDIDMLIGRLSDAIDDTARSLGTV